MRAVYSQFILTLSFLRKEKNGTLPWVPFLGGRQKKEKFPPSMDGWGKFSPQELEEQGMIQRR